MNDSSSIVRNKKDKFISRQMSKSLLAVLSHVAHGYVGNRAMVFPLQFNGWDVDCINTTNYSNHPGYLKFKGQPSSSSLVKDLFTGLKNIIDFNNEYEIILTGYSPNEEILQVVYDEIMPIFKASANKKPVWVVDPVLGDNGKLYVLEKVVPIYKQILSTGHITLTTPNQFEFELLSGTTIKDWSSVESAFDSFYNKFKIPYVVLSSVVIDDKMFTIGYSNSNRNKRIFSLPLNQINCSFNGCGDVFTAILTNTFYDNGKELTPEVLASAIVKLNKILIHSLQQELTKTGQAPNDIKLVKDIKIITLRHTLLEDYQQDTQSLLQQVKYLDTMNQTI